MSAVTSMSDEGSVADAHNMNGTRSVDQVGVRSVCLRCASVATKCSDLFEEPDDYHT